MSSLKPGWYPDTTTPTQMRWWDGTGWTGDVYDRVEPPGGYLSEAPGGADATTTPAQAPIGPATTTEDDVPLASWGQRAVARLVDVLVTTAVTVLLSLSVATGLVRHLIDVSQAQQASGVFDPFAAYDTQTVRDLAIIGLVGLVVTLAYEMGFLMWRAATPGKLLLGLKVRRWAPGERLAASVVARRWIGFQGLGQLLGTPYTLIDVLWPLWDPRRQALHDKLAGTCVVRAPGRR